MDLTKMSRDDLSTLQGHLRTIGTATDVMAEGGLEPEICLTCEETVIRVAPILSAGVPAPLPDPVLLEPVQVSMPHGDSVPVGAVDVLAEAPIPSQPAVPSAVVPPPDAPKAPPAAQPDELVTGPLSEEERAEILRMDRDGVPRGEIAQALNRRVQVISLFLTAQIGSDGKARHKAPEPPAAPFVHVAEAAAAVVDKAVAAGAPPAPAVDPAADLRGLDRDIWRHLDRLPMAKGWDIEMDLDMVEAFARGSTPAIVAADLGCDSKAVVDRYKALTAVIRDDRGQMTMDGQVRFQNLLRRRVALHRTKVA